MSFNFSNEKPIFLQIAELLKSQIVSGKFRPGEKLKSVRDYAFEFGVNPNTVQKALSLLESEGIIYTDRTNGKFVCTNAENLNNSKEAVIFAKLNQFFDEMQQMGVSKNEIIKLIKSKGDKNE